MNTMSNVPETIWALNYCREFLDKPAKEDMPYVTEYHIKPTKEQIMADPRVKALVEAASRFHNAFLAHDGGRGPAFHQTWQEQSDAFHALTTALAQLKEPKL
jgi:hypothetical protein